MTDLHSGCSLWAALICKSCKGSVVCEEFELLKHTHAELYNWEADHSGYCLVFGSGRAKCCGFLDICVFTSQSRIQWHHNRGRQKYCWSHATQRLCEDILVIDSVVSFSASFSRTKCCLISSNPIALPTFPPSFSPSPHPLCFHYQQAIRYPFGRTWTWVKDQQHVSFGIHSNDPVSCLALLPPSCLPHLLSFPLSEVKSFVFSSCTSSVLCVSFPTRPHPPFDSKASSESITRTLLREIKIWYSCLFYLQGFSSISLCVQP